MISVFSLWLPIVASAAVVFVVSAMVWMVLPHHKKDFARADDEDGLMDAVRKSVSGAGMVYFPWADGKEMNTEEYRDKVRAGPVGILRVRDPEAVLDMRASLLKSMVLYLAVSLLVAYVAALGLEPGAPYMSVFKVVSTTAFLSYGFVGFQESVWFGLPGSVAFKHALDGLAYALLTAGIFGWLWPA